ncbi:MAG: aldehyde dehydrogenase family protein, partial [Jiangellaceae bacterium]
NGGQVCLCPDYVFVPSEGKAEFIATVEQQFHRSFPTILDNPAHCAIVDDKNYERVIDLVADAWAKGANVIEAVPPGESLPSAEQRRIAPTILTDVTNDMDVTTEEVFGPVLTVHTYDRLDEVITYVNARPSPLASYWYGGDSADFRAFCDLTRSGGITRNDFALHAAIDGAPFGGVGQSGSGGYHGKTGFDAFSHYRTVCESRLPVSMTSLLVPPNPPLLDAAVNWAARRQAKRLRRRIEEYRRDSDCPAPPGKGG